MTVAMVVAAGAFGVTGGASAASSPARDAPSVECPDVCITLYDPVVCVMKGGSVRVFGNSCEAEVYACQHPGEIIFCWPK
jgi:hypothetical protein